MSSEENTWGKGGDTGNVWYFVGTVGKWTKKFEISGWKVFVMKKINWESLWTEGRFELDKEEDGGDYSINDDCW